MVRQKEECQKLFFITHGRSSLWVHVKPVSRGGADTSVLTNKKKDRSLRVLKKPRFINTFMLPNLLGFLVFRWQDVAFAKISCVFFQSLGKGLFMCISICVRRSVNVTCICYLYIYRVYLRHLLSPVLFCFFSLRWLGSQLTCVITSILYKFILQRTSWRQCLLSLHLCLSRASFACFVTFLFLLFVHTSIGLFYNRVNLHIPFSTFSTFPATCTKQSV